MLYLFFPISLVLFVESGETQFAYPYIGSGIEAQRGEFPYLGAITNNGVIKCSGMVITENLVLTAAHCLVW